MAAYPRFYVHYTKRDSLLYLKSNILLKKLARWRQDILPKVPFSFKKEEVASFLRKVRE
jgi:hypothetical protein